MRRHITSCKACIASALSTPEPATADTAPQKAEPIAKAPSADNTCNADARERTEHRALLSGAGVGLEHPV